MGEGYAGEGRGDRTEGRWRGGGEPGGKKWEGKELGQERTETKKTEKNENNFTTTQHRVKRNTEQRGTLAGFAGLKMKNRKKNL